MLRKYFVPLLIIVWLTACRKKDEFSERVVYGNSFVLTIHSDKAVYHPGETVQFRLNRPVEGAKKVRYKHLNEIIHSESITGDGWSWQTPQADFKGYFVELLVQGSAGDSVIAAIGVDVSSDWTKFPRYGFLSNYGNLSEREMNNVLERLNRLHINGLQYYDWQYKHHRPLAGTEDHPLQSWKEISNKDVYLKTLKYYITEAGKRNMKSMFYNLAFGVLEDGFSDGVSRSWMLYKDPNAVTIDQHELPKPFFKSSILVADAGNAHWQQYIAGENDKVYRALNFDGYHVDALGDRGALYNYEGESVDQQKSFKSFLQAMKQKHPQKHLVMNAVNQWGKNDILQSPVDFAYTEVWSPNNSYDALRRIIAENFEASGGKATVLAAYLNYGKNSSPGEFNTHSVLLANAVIFASGGAHLEMGEHMLGSEYFPNNNLKMPDALNNAITGYYDFLVAYQNLLRDGGDFIPKEFASEGFQISEWPGKSGEVAFLSKQVGNRQVFHLINFTGAGTLQWRDDMGLQKSPDVYVQQQCGFRSATPVKKLWMASPDYQYGTSVEIPFQQNGDVVTFKLPYLKYWTMVVAEY